MPNESQSDPVQRLIARLPDIVIKAKAVLGLKELPSNIGLEPWEAKAIRYVLDGPLSSFQPAILGKAAGLTPAAWGELAGAGMSVIISIMQPSDQSSVYDAAVPAAAEFRRKNRESIGGLIAPFLDQVKEPEELISRIPSIKIQREFVAGYLRGLNAIFEDDAETLRNESAKFFLCFLFLTHAEELRPGAGMTITQVHKWINELTIQSISLENVRKVAAEIGLKLADVGHPSGQLLPTVKNP